MSNRFFRVLVLFVVSGLAASAQDQYPTLKRRPAVASAPAIASKSVASVQAPTLTVVNLGVAMPETHVALPKVVNLGVAAPIRTQPAGANVAQVVNLGRPGHPAALK
jgi:hypothetical protein